MQGQPKIEVLLEEVVRKKASDLHLQVGLPPMLRVDGKLVSVTAADILTEEMVEALIFAILDEDQKQILLKDKEFDFSFAFGNIGRFRVNAFHERGNLAAALRLIPNEILTIEQLGLPPIIDKFAQYPRGLVLVTGPTGSGKSTTLAAMVHKINLEQGKHIITIEDPIEYAHKSKKSIVVQREVHYDTYSFSTALRSALREDPDVVLIGEMRDLETIASAITIAETGHLVLATLHTNSAAQSIDRMIDVFPPHQQSQIRAQLSNILMAICSQRLIPAIGGGRIAAAEILVSTSAVRNIIREGKSHQLEAVIQTGADHGMQSMDKTLVNLIKNGTITYDEAKEYAVDLEELDRIMRE
ncbi:MAG TPA: type IV pilus twitching motility protein PilT [Candidatus Saccharimonadales bacterium]|nr:type IV pilus twitching motility protein PilT [Candidatus Saccharimonadales bacterium]